MVKIVVMLLIIMAGSYTAWSVLNKNDFMYAQNHILSNSEHVKLLPIKELLLALFPCVALLLCVTVFKSKVALAVIAVESCIAWFFAYLQQTVIFSPKPGLASAAYYTMQYTILFGLPLLVLISIFMINKFKQISSST